MKKTKIIDLSIPMSKAPATLHRLKLYVEDLEEALRKIGYRIKPWDIVLIQTGADK